jgi:hypothetical protein
MFPAILHELVFLLLPFEVAIPTDQAKLSREPSVTHEVYDSMARGKHRAWHAASLREASRMARRKLPGSFAHGSQDARENRAGSSREPHVILAASSRVPRGKLAGSAREGRSNFTGSLLEPLHITLFLARLAGCSREARARHRV